MPKICSSQWTVEQQNLIQSIAQAMLPGIKTIAIPPRLNVMKGDNAVVEFLKNRVKDLELLVHA